MRPIGREFDMLVLGGQDASIYRRYYMNKSLNKCLTNLRDISPSLLHLNSLGEPLNTTTTGRSKKAYLAP